MLQRDRQPGALVSLGRRLIPTCPWLVSQDLMCKLVVLTGRWLKKEDSENQVTAFSDFGRSSCQCQGVLVDYSSCSLPHKAQHNNRAEAERKEREKQPM